MAAYVFQNLPENYRLPQALEDGVTTIWWRTTAHNSRLQIGDTVYLWQAKGHEESNWGLHGVASVIERPRLLSFDEFDNYWVKDSEKSVADEHTLLRIEQRAARGHHVQQEAIVASPRLGKKGVFRGNQGVNFQLTPEEALELQDVWNAHAIVRPEVSDVVEPVRVIDSETLYDETAREHLEKAAANLRGKSLRELEELIATPGRKRDDEARPIVVAGRQRDPAVVAYALARANNRCEVDGCDASLFMTKSGLSYLEVHHLTPLGRGGRDVIENVAAVCPSHHREAHLGREGGRIDTVLAAVRVKDR